MTIQRGTRIVFGLALCLCASVAISPANAQFTTIINVPSDTAPSEIGSNTQLNLSTGGSLATWFTAGASDGTSTNIEVNISGGNTDRYFNAYNGSIINLTAGSIGHSSSAHEGSTFNILGGYVGRFFRADAGSHVNIHAGVIEMDFMALPHSIVNIDGSVFERDLEASANSTVTIRGGDLPVLRAQADSRINLHGGEFFLDGVVIPGLANIGDTAEIDVPAGSRLTMTLADGSVRTFGQVHGDAISPNTIKLIRSNLPSSPHTLNVPTDPAPQGLRPGQTLNLSDGGRLKAKFTAINATMNINGGYVDSNLIADAGSIININGGLVAGNFNALSGSTVNISSGRVTSYFRAESGSTVNLIGGLIDGWARAYANSDFKIMSGRANELEAHSDSHVEMTGGLVEDLIAYSGSRVELRGGQIQEHLYTLSGSKVEVFGGEFYLNGTHLSGLDAPGDSISINLAGDSRLTMTLTDGTVRTFGSVREDGIDDGTLTLTRTNLPIVNDRTINVPGQQAPNGLRPGHVLNVSSGGYIPHAFTAIDATVNLNGGNTSSNLMAETNSIFNINNGNLGEGFHALSGSIVNINGGRVQSNFHANTSSAVFITGGIVERGFNAFPGSTINIFGTSFTLNGIDISADLFPGGTTIVIDRDRVLQGTLADGTEFSFDLHSTPSVFDDYFDPAATLTITLIPEPGTIGLVGVGALGVMRRRRRAS